MPMRAVKFFTPIEANQTLPLVKKIVEDIIALGGKLRLLSEEYGPSLENNLDASKMLSQLNELFEELENIGCSYRDWNFSIGLVDFPSMIDETPVLLCWRSDEKKVTYYHGLQEGFAGRKLIPDHLL
jgi:hypothetical protein